MSEEIVIPSERMTEHSGALIREADATGAEWDVRILRFGKSKNGWVWTREVAEELLRHLANAPVGLVTDHAGRLGHPTEQGGRVIVGEIASPRIEADGVYGRLRLAPAVGWLKESLLGLASRSKLGEAIGLSIDTMARYAEDAGGRVIKGIQELFGVDIVGEPSADGRFIRATAGPVLTPKEEHGMREKTLALIKKHRPQLLDGRVIESVTDEQLERLLEEALTPPEAGPEPKAAPPPVTKSSDGAALQRLTALEQRLAVREAQARIAEALAASTLPEPVKAKLRKGWEGKVVTGSDIRMAIKEEAETLAKLAESGNPQGFGDGRTEITAAPADKLQAAMDRLFGIEEKTFDRAMENAPFLHRETTTRIRESLKPALQAASQDPGLRFRSIREAYVAITGDVDVSGFLPARRVTETIESATWANILGNTLYRRMLMTYAEPVFNERSIASYGSATDFRNKEITVLDYFPDISTVDPEVADYTEITALNDAKVTYAVVQRGNLLTITRKTIINDDLRAVTMLPERLGRAARRTLAKAIWNFWVNNSNYDVDSTAWFHTNHGNTGSTALTADATGATEVLAKVTQLINMTEQGSGEKLGMPPMDSLWLDVPPALYGVARMLNLTQYFGTTASNPVYGWFGAPERGERININTLLTDTTDWGLHVSPGAGGRESIVVDFLQGREEPEFFLADQPTVGQAFVGDKIQYKIRHEYGADIADFRGAVKNVVAGG